MRSPTLFRFFRFFFHPNKSLFLDFSDFFSGPKRFSRGLDSKGREGVVILVNAGAVN